MATQIVNKPRMDLRRKAGVGTTRKTTYEETLRRLNKGSLDKGRKDFIKHRHNTERNEKQATQRISKSGWARVDAKPSSTNLHSRESKKIRLQE